MNKLNYTDHAVQRMMERDITHDLVLAVISNYDGKIKQSQDKQIFYKKVKNREDNLIAVIIVGNSNILTVMTYFEVKK